MLHVPAHSAKKPHLAFVYHLMGGWVLLFLFFAAIAAPLHFTHTLFLCLFMPSKHTRYSSKLLTTLAVLTLNPKTLM